MECLYDRVVLDTAYVIARSEEPQLRIVHQHECAGNGAFLYNAAITAADKLCLCFNPRDDNGTDGNILSLSQRDFKKCIRSAEEAELLNKHVEKRLHGQFYRIVEDTELSKPLTFDFLKSAELKSETEGYIFACQDGVVNTSERRRVWDNTIYRH